MFKQLLLDDSTAIVTVVAFAIAATIYVSFAWRAVRMNRRQVEQFALLPFKTPTPAVGARSHDFARDPEPVEGLDGARASSSGAPAGINPTSPR